MTRRSSFGASLALLASSIVHAQQPGGGRPAPSTATPRFASASRTAQIVTIDGVLDDPAWQQATPIGDFIQSEPLQGQAATEKTEVRVLFTASTIYVGVICSDSDPSGIVTTDSRRDSDLTGQDSFQIIFDTYHDRQNGFIFGTNSVGVQYDAQVRNEGETIRGGPFTGISGGNATGAGAGLNTNWDGVWDVKTRVTETGWTAEFAIPLRTLRYSPPPQTWGVNFSRNIERKRELDYWSPVSRIFTLARLSSAGELRGLDFPAPRDFKVIPYAISSSNRTFTSPSEASYAQSRDWGLDSKIGVTSSTTLDLTYNTDFAQVEVDEQQINLTRFNLLFPEKRPFFLENRGLFAVGRPGEIDLFFSRRIGIDDTGALIPIHGGARLTGKTRGLNVGLLNMQTAAVDDTAANNFTAARLNKDLPNRSSIGAMFVNREATGRLAGPDNYNRTYSVDGKLGIRQAVSISGFAARTQTPGKDGRDYAYSSAFDLRTRTYETSLAYTEVGDDFNPEVGFLKRPDGYRQINTTLRRHLRTPALARIGLRELEPHGSYESYWGFDGLQETATLHLDVRWDFEKNYGLNATALNVQYEGLREPFEVYPGVVVPVGHYRSPYFLGSAHTDARKWINADMAWNIGGFLSGNQVMLSPTLNIRHGGRWLSSLRWTRSDIDLPQGAFVTNLGSARLTYNFSTFVNASTLIQYNDRTRRWSTNLRFTWLRTAAAGFYMVYNDTESMNGLGPVSRAFVVKYAHQFDLLH